MPIDTQIDVALGVLAFLAAQAFIGAGFFLFRLLKQPAGSLEARETEEGVPGAFPRHA
jgi:hypothetical protein